MLAVALVVAALKFCIASSTSGTNDVYNFQAFANQIRQLGPIGIYGHRLVIGKQIYPPYNHPPLIGWLLVGINHLTDAGLSFRFLIRAPAVLADIVTSMLVFELVRMQRTVRDATIAGIAIALCPALIIVSGFHGNTDPVFVMFATLSMFLLVRDRSAALAGLSFGVAISVKIVPVVVLPVLLLTAARSGRRRLVEFVAGGGAVFVLLWVPVLLRRFTEFDKNVIGFRGYNKPLWGLPEFASLAGVSNHWLVAGSGPILMLVLSAGLPLLVAWRRPDAAIRAFGLALVLVMLLSTATGTRYLVWACAAAFLVDVWAGLVFNIGASYFMTVVYDRWNDHSYPWDWNRAHAADWTHHEVAIGVVVWVTLLAVAIIGLLPRRGRGPAAGPDPAVAAPEADDTASPTSPTARFS